MAIFIPKSRVTPLEKCQVSDFLNFLCLLPGKKKLEKWPLLDQNHGLIPLEKCQVFDFFELYVFIALKGVFSFQNIIKDIFLIYIAEKKRMEKRPVLYRNHGLTPLEKCQVFHFLNFMFLQPRKAFFSLQNIRKDIFLAFFA